ncbi:MAG: DUF3108 domain-containing protein [Gammaproteobacteria bacterium]|jgi:hypothetical protein
MNRCRSKLPSLTRLSLLLIALASGPAAAAAEVALRPFSASYDLYQGGMHLAIMDLRLERQGEVWRWVSITRARGIYKLFTDKQPYSETRFERFGDQLLTIEITLGENGGEQPEENARFDWEKGRLEVLRKGKSKDLRLHDQVYDYQSIHLLAASMGQQQLDKATIDFYRSGKLVKSRFIFSGRQTVDVGGSSVEANVYEQVLAKSKSKIKYYYDAQKPLLPLRIEKLEAGESPSILSLREVKWGL